MRRSVFQTSMREARAACQDALRLISRNVIAWHSVYEHLIGIRILDCIHCTVMLVAVFASSFSLRHRRLKIS